MKIAQLIDHTLLKPQATPLDIKNLCQEAQKHNFASVCVNPTYVSLCKKLLKGNLTICTTIGFPLGATSTQTKVAEAKQAIKDGAKELDMVMAIGRLKAKDYTYVKKDIAAVTKLAHSKKVIVKVILETSLLSDKEKTIACQVCLKAKADFVKTSTGFGKSGATIKDVKLLKKAVKLKAKVKASGGINTYHQAVQMIKAGANRLGTSSGVKIVTTAYTP